MSPQDDIIGRFYLLGTVPPPVGGVTTFIERRLERLRSERVAVSFRDWKRMDFLDRLRWILEIVLRPGAATFELHGYETWPMLALLLRPFRRRIVFYLHSARMLHVYTGLRSRIAARMLAVSDVGIFVSTATRDAFRERGWTMPSTIRVSPSWIPPDPSTQQELYRRYSDETRGFVESHWPLLVMQGSEGWHAGADLYGSDLAIELIIRLRESHPAAGLLIGRPSTGSTKFRSLIRRLDDRLAEAGCLSAVHVLGANQPLWPIIAASDVFLRPTADDGDSISVREALMLGTPVVASDAAPRPDGVTLFRSRDLDDLVRVVSRHPAVVSGLPVARLLQQDPENPL